MTTTPEHPEHRPADDFVSTEELARRHGVKPITSLDEVAQPDLWESDEEYEAFLADLPLRLAPCRHGVSYVVVDTDVASAILKGPIGRPRPSTRRPTARDHVRHGR